MSYLNRTNKHIMANILALLCFFIAISVAPHSLAEVNSETKLYSQEGYPYGPLVQRIESVKIRYLELKNKQVQCSTEISGMGQNWKGKVHKVSQSKFNKTPLKACLDRDLAKHILAGTYL